MQDFYEFTNELPLNTVRAWNRSLLEDTKWSFSGLTGDPREPYRHWSSPAELAQVADVWNCINYSFTDEGFKLKPVKILLNLFNHGDSSWIHRDIDEAGFYTAIVFLNDRWDINWAGETVIVDDNNEIVKSFAPTPGKFILFKSNLRHGARPVSREAPYPRLGLTFQCKNANNL